MPFTIYLMQRDDPTGTGPRTPIGVYPGDDQESAIVNVALYFAAMNPSIQNWHLVRVTEAEAETIRARLAPAQS